MTPFPGGKPVPPTVYRCPRCRREGPRDHWITKPRQGIMICGSCWYQGCESMPEEIERVAEVLARAVAETLAVAETERAGERIDGDTMDFRMKAPPDR